MRRTFWSLRGAISLLCLGMMLYVSITAIAVSYQTTSIIAQADDHISAAGIFRTKGLQTCHKVSMREDEKEAILQGSTAMDDPCLLQLIRNEFIHPPSSQAYKLDHPEKTHFSLHSQSQYVDLETGQKEGGFFVECGATDGEYHSNTLFLERERGWNGLLIEASHKHFESMMKKHRKAHTVEACLSLTTRASIEMFTEFNTSKGLSGLTSTLKQQNKNKLRNLKTNKYKVQCFPLYSLLLALNVTTVDFFSLDIEGPELDVLQTIPFDKIKFQIITIEYEDKNIEIMADKIEGIKNVILGTGEYEFVGYFLKKAIKKEPYYTKELNNFKQGADVVFRRKI